MKNKTVELMTRNQFNIPSDAAVNVVFLQGTDQWYDFEIEWWIEDTRHQCNCRLPHIEYVSQEF